MLVLKEGFLEKENIQGQKDPPVYEKTPFPTE